MAFTIGRLFGILKEAISEFIDDDALKLSASLAYFTVFSVGPLLLVVITILSEFYERSIVTGKVFQQLSQLMGRNGAAQIQLILENITKQTNTTLFGIIGTIILLFGATGIFSEIQGSINYIWSIRAKPKNGWLKYLRDRLLSFSLVVGIGFLMMVTLIIDLLIDMLTKRLQLLLGNNMWIIKGIDWVLMLAIVAFLFAIIYKVLPDARIAWKDAAVGAVGTAILFLVGKFLITAYIANSNTTVTYGAAASIIILLIWVYFSAIILYFGAEFTKVYALTCGKGITVYDTAVYIVKREEKELPVKRIEPKDSQTPPSAS